MRSLTIPAAILAMALDTPSRAVAQSATTRLTVFLDCRTDGCDRDFLITEIPFVALTQDRLDAEVHVLVTDLDTGAGGRQLTFAFLGQGRFSRRSDTLTTAIPPNSTDDAERREVARVLKLGLVPYAVRTAAFADLDLRLRERDDDDERRPGTAGLADPWNFWVFDLDLNGEASAESNEHDFEFESRLSASRVTEASKSEVDLDWEYQGRSVTLSDGEKRSFALRRAEFEAYHIKSFGDHWSAGGTIGLGTDEFNNQDARAELTGVLEYSFFPYRLATQKQIVATAQLGVRHFDYAEETIYLRFSETRPVASVVLAGESRQRWGSTDASLSWDQFLHDAGAYSLSLDARADFRISRGLSLSFSAFGSKINDQLYLSREGLDDDEILTEQRSLATAYRFGGSVGISFTFGSIFNTIVNPRFNRNR